MTKEDIIEQNPILVQLIGNHGVGAFQLIGKAMDEWAKQQAIAFVKYNCPDIKFDDTLLNAGYAGFLIHQHQEQQNKEQ